MFSDPQKILNQVSIVPGSVVCDIGAGAGFYTLLLSQMVGDNGRVYAVEIQKEILARLSNELKIHHRFNVEVIWGDAEKLGGTKIRDGLADFVVAANVLFQMEHKDIFIKEITRVLKPHGKLLLVDWSGSYDNMGPHKDQVVTQEQAKALFESKGFTVEKSLDAGAHHYAMICTKA